MERADWMNAAVRQEIEALRRRYGFEMDEAVAFWHLSEAQQLLNDLAIANNAKMSAIWERKYEAEGLDTTARAGRRLADQTSFTAELETRISQHFHALYTVLGRQVLRRNYPEGWGWEFVDEAE